MSSSAVSDDRPVDVRAVMGELWRGRFWILASVIVCTAAFSAIAFLTTPVYRATAVLMPAGADRGIGRGIGVGELGGAFGQLSGLMSLAGINLGSAATTTEESLAVLRSQQFIESFILDNGLMPLLFADQWDSARKTWAVPERNRPTPRKAFRYFSRKVMSVTQDRKTGLVTLQIQWKDREQAAEWANELVQRINAEMRKRAIKQSSASIKYLQDEFNKTSEVSIREAISRLIEAQIKQRMLATVTQEYAFRFVDKASPPDKDERVKPRRRLLVASGFLLGLALGSAGVLLAGALGPRK